MADIKAIINAVEVLRAELPKLHETLNHAGDVGRIQDIQSTTNEHLIRLAGLFQAFTTAQDNVNARLLQQQQDLMDRVTSLEGALMAGRATYTLLASNSNGSASFGAESMDTRTQDYPSPESIILTLPQEDAASSVHSFPEESEESEEETLRKLQEDLMDVPGSTRGIINIISGSRTPMRERSSPIASRSRGSATMEGTAQPLAGRQSQVQSNGSPRSSSRSHRSRLREPIRSYAVATEERSEPGDIQPVNFASSAANPFRRRMGATTSESPRTFSRVTSPALHKAPATQKARAVPSPVQTRASTPATIPRTASGSPRKSPSLIGSPTRFSTPSPPASTSRVPPSLPQQRVLDCIRELANQDTIMQGADLPDIVQTLRDEDNEWTAESMLDALEFLEDNNYVVMLGGDRYSLA